MRIIAGSCRGRKLNTLKGMNTRPTADRVKEALFSVLAPYINGARVLDAFAGSGALGLEALSRGAESVLFCERNRAAAQICETNIAACALPGARLINGDVLHILPRLRAEDSQLCFELIFLDPPYRSDLLSRTAGLIADYHLLAADGVLVAETAADTPPLTDERFTLLKEKKYGDTMIRFYINPKNS